MNRKFRIEEALNLALSPLHVEVADESHMHSVPPGAESHFKVTVVSSGFDGQSLVARHRSVNGLMTAEFQTGLHALAIHALTPEEWYARGGLVPDSPPCQGGQKAAGQV